MSGGHKIGVTGHRRHRSEPAPTAKAVIDETFPHYLGLYNGKASRVLVAEDGTSYASLGLQLPPDCTFVAQVIWGSIGYSVGSLLGTLTAAPDRRHLLFVGDGSFQLTAQEVSTMLRHDYKPVIFLINNGGYTIERCWLGKTARYNDVANWAYADLPKVFHPDTRRGRSW